MKHKNLWKRLLSSVLCLCMVLSLLPSVSVRAAQKTYDGVPVEPKVITAQNYTYLGLTSENWSRFNGYYAIRSAGELYGFAALVNAQGGKVTNAVLLADIVVNETVGAQSGAYQWTPIGAGYNPYVGTFDGNGHSISGLYFDDGEKAFIGLFGVAGIATADPKKGSANIQNIVLENSYFSASGYVGGIVGVAQGNHVTISSCKVAPSVYLQGDEGLVGGIVGGYGSSSMHITRVHQIKNSVSFGTVTSTKSKYLIGAIVGQFREEENAFSFFDIENTYYLEGCATDCDGESKMGRGGSYNTASDRDCTPLQSINASHTCVNVTHITTTPTCQYTGRSGYSYCLICEKVTEGQLVDSPTVEHSYSIATCLKPATCHYCGMTKGTVDEKNHEGQIATYEYLDDARHYGIYSCCNARTEDLPHNYSVADCLNAGVCGQCGATSSVDPNHHVGEAKIYVLDSNDHTKHQYKWECCGGIIQTEAHSFDETYTCTNCMYSCEHPTIVNETCIYCGKKAVVFMNRYWDATTGRVISERTITGDTSPVTAGTTSLPEGWYIVNGDTRVEKRITVSGTVHLILGDGCTLDAMGGIAVNAGATLYIYGQDMGTGTLNASGESDASIGGNSNTKSGTITICGGVINAITDGNAAGIGGGYYSHNGTITILGGTITAQSKYYGSGIGGGYHGHGGTISIHGGSITAITRTGAGIGGGEYGDGADVLLTGGNIKVDSYYDRIIGAGSRGEKPGSLQNGAGEELTLVKHTLNGADALTEVTALTGAEGYGLTDVKTLDTNVLYLYLSSTQTVRAVTAGGKEYICNTNNVWNESHDAEIPTCVKGTQCNTCGLVLEKDPANHVSEGITDGFYDCCGGYVPAVLTGDVYEISTAGQLFWLGNQIRNGSIQSFRVKLTADIVFPTGKVWEPVNVPEVLGSVFDGNGHYIHLGTQSTGLFERFNYAKICNLTLHGTINGNGGNVGAVVGSAYRTSISNVVSYVDVNNPTGNAGGLVGYYGGQHSTAQGLECKIRNCAVYADVQGNRAGGFIGEGWNGYQYYDIANCAYVGNVTGTDAGAIVGYHNTDYNTCTFTDVYWCEADGLGFYGRRDTANQVYTNTEAKPLAAFLNGEVTWLLNGSTATGDWKQTLGGDTYPTFSGDMVYYGYYSCGDTEPTYSNNEAYHEIPQHGWKPATCTEPQTCTSCGKTEGVARGHAPERDDGNCMTPIFCSVCYGIVVEGRDAHSFVAGVCTNDGCEIRETYTMTYYASGEKVHADVHTSGSAYYLWTAGDEGELKFLGWAAEEGGELLYHVGDYIWPEGDMAFYAVYSKVHTITYYHYDSEGNAYWDGGSVQVADGDPVVLGEQYSYWFKCIGWATEPGGELVYTVGQEISPNSDLELYAVAVPFRATVDPGAEDAVFVDGNGENITVLIGAMPYSTVRLTAFPERPGYRFLGFRDMENGYEYLVDTDMESGEVYLEISMTEDIALIALWEADAPTDTTVKFNHTLNLASDISVNFLISASCLTGYDMTASYVEFTYREYTGNAVTGTKTLRVMPVKNGEYYYYFTFSGINAVMMNDDITAVFYGVKDGVLYRSHADVYSVADYALSQLNKVGGAVKLKTLCADLLRYGTKAQIFKSYRLDALVDDAMTEAHRAYLSDMEAVTFGNTNVVLEDLPNAPITWVGKSLSLESKVALKFVFNPANYIGELSALTLRISYVDAYGNTETATIADPALYNAQIGYYVFTVDSLLASELRAVVSVQIYAGDTPVSATLQYSPDTYGNGKSGTLLDLCKALFAYSDSAKAYFAS